jgi:hypothetical protein
MHGAQKTYAEVTFALREVLQVTQRYWDMLPDLDKRYTRAAHSLREASLYLGHHPSYAAFWDRSAGVRHLFAALQQCPRIAFSSHFLRLCRRAVLPKRLFRSSPWRSSRI